MKDIGEKLKQARENIGVSIDEVADDLKLRPSQIVSIEEGQEKDFEDILILKSYIKEYAKYLGLKSDDLVDEFNEYLFDCTSKISLNDIKKARQKINNKKKKENKNDISSPYTKESESNKKIIILITIIVIALIALVLILFMQFNKDKNDNVNDSVVTVWRNYELT